MMRGSLSKGIGLILIGCVISKVAAQANEGCPCLESFPQSFLDSEFYDQEEGCIRVAGQCYSQSYGLATCATHDLGLEPSCNVLGFPGNPDFCEQEFCFVDRNRCNQDYYESSYFPGTGLYYSYRTCGSINSFLGWFSDGITRTFTDLIVLIEKYVLGTKKALEATFAEISSGQATDCFAVYSCNGCSSCQDNQCWQESVDTKDVNTVFHPTLQQSSSTEDLETLTCSASLISSIYRRVAGKEYDDEDRVAFQYFGSQDTGAMVQWPATPFCSETFDARRRPWYASAVSGPKDIVIAIDVSGSMADGDRIPLARSAAKAVLDTLTWVDHVSILTFDSSVAGVSSPTLQRATESNIADLKVWVDDNVRPAGGTSFVEPLETAYRILANSKDSDFRSSCTQVVIFLTDGQADLTQDRMDDIANANNQVVVFSYGLGSGAERDALQLMACRTGGIYYDVPVESELPKVMAAYYEYFATLQEPCKLAWISYTDAVTSTTLVSGCSAIYDSNTLTTKLIGVHCTDLNLIVSPSQLETCANNGYDSFIRAVRVEAEKCGRASRVEDPCVLAQLRNSAGPRAVCPSDVDLATCGNTNIAANLTECPEVENDRFGEIPLSGCEDNFSIECTLSSEDESTESFDTTVAIAVVAGLIVVLLVFAYIKSRVTKTEGHKNERQENDPENSGNQGQVNVATSEAVPTSYDTSAIPIAVKYEE